MILICESVAASVAHWRIFSTLPKATFNHFREILFTKSEKPFCATHDFFSAESPGALSSNVNPNLYFYNFAGKINVYLSVHPLTYSHED